MLGAVEFAFDLGTAIVSKTLYRPNSSLPEHRHEKAYFTIVLQGSYTELRGSTPDRLVQGMLVYHPRGDVHADAIHATTASTLNVELSESDLPGQPCTIEGRAVGGLTSELVGGLQTSSSLTRRAIDAIVSSIRIAARREIRYDPLLSNAHALLMSRLQSGVCAIADDLGVNRSAFSRKFSKAYGRSPGQQRIYARAQTAARLLARCDYSLTAIALECGYYDHSQFCRQFKRAIGMTPSAFRKYFASTGAATIVQDETGESVA